MAKALTVGGLFSGIGGWELGLERAGMEVAWHCEADPFCRRVLEKHWPGVPTFEDVCTLNAGMAEGVDVLCGGFPCQDISLAGKGAGIDGARSGLWSEFARLIGEFRPRYVCVENVSALLGRGLDRVLGDLSALGFDAEWDCIPASAVGAPHRRDRVWLVAYPSRDLQAGASTLRAERERAWTGSQPEHSHPDSGRLQERPQLNSDSTQDPAYGDSCRRHADGLRYEVADPDSSGSQGRTLPVCECSQVARAGYTSPLADPASLNGSRPECCGDCSRGPETASRDCGGRSGAVGNADISSEDAYAEASSSRQGVGESGWWSVEPDVGRVANGVPARVDRLRSLGNALVPQIAEWIGSRIVAYEDSLDGVPTA